MSAEYKPRERFAQSFAYRDRAERVLARGVSSTPRATQRPVPIVQRIANGCVLTDLDGNQVLDFALGYGPLLLGHTPRAVVEAVKSELDRGLRTGGVTSGEARLAELIASCLPGAEVSTFLSSGTEAVQLALRIARAATGRSKVIKFRSHYHGWADSIHVANSIDSDGPTTQGQDPQAAANIVVLDWGDVSGLQRALDPSVAAVIMEPAAVNAGCFGPNPGFLEDSRALVQANGSLLIYDEVITGFRLGLSGAQGLYGVTPDLTVLGKVLGGGLPLSAVTGSRVAMQPVMAGAVMHRGTYNGNPLSVAAGIACLTYLMDHQHEIYPRMEALVSRMASGIRERAAHHGVPIRVNHLGTCLQYFVSRHPVDQIADLVHVEKENVVAFSELLLRHGVMTLPRGLMYLSTEHTESDITIALEAFDAAMREFVEAPQQSQRNA